MPSPPVSLKPAVMMTMARAPAWMESSTAALTARAGTATWLVRIVWDSRFTQFLTIILPVLAALATMLAIQRRLGEYR